jgi:ABC-type Mn2+/Zn2+ transport system ATPase subunit
MGLQTSQEKRTAAGYFRAGGSAWTEPASDEARGHELRPLLVMDGVTLGYGRQVVLGDVTLTIRHGEFLGIVGPNGSGKSTLLKAILGLHPPLKGRVQVAPSGGRGETRLHYGYVPQRDTVNPLFPLSVRQIVAMGRFGRVGIGRRLDRCDRAVVDEALARVGIADLSCREYSQLSGGQRQRTLIARALCGEPDLLILDEPTNGMDLASEHALLELIAQLHREGNLTCLMVSHLLNNVANYADRIAIIAGERLEVGERESMLDEARLSALYQIPVRVEQIGARRVILAGEETGGDR